MSSFKKILTGMWYKQGFNPSFVAPVPGPPKETQTKAVLTTRIIKFAPNLNLTSQNYLPAQEVLKWHTTRT